MTRPLHTLWIAALAVACGTTPPKTTETVARRSATTEPAQATARLEPFERRAFAPMYEGAPVLAGISYGPFREGQRPGGPDPSAEQILEDLRILAPRWHMIRFYSSRGPAETILRTLRDNDLPITAVVGAWIGPDADADNAAEVAEAVRLANAYPEQVIAVSVGNESQVEWSGHRTPSDVLIRHIRHARAGVAVPVTTADDYNFWNKPESHAVADEIDFLLLHAYAMWNQQPLAEAVSWTNTTVASIAKEHPDLTIVIGETGWATALNPEGNEVKYIKAPAGEAEQAAFYKEFSRWAAEAGVPYFYFEAFDEPWKGSKDPREVEKHWGLYSVDRRPKAALRGAP